MELLLFCTHLMIQRDRLRYILKSAIKISFRKSACTCTHTAEFLWVHADFYSIIIYIYIYIYIHVYIHVYTYVCMHIYIYRERERESVYVCVFIYI